MKTLEGMAKELFEKFAFKETGKVLQWKHLDDDRKIEWIRDVFEVADYYMEELRSQLKPLPVNPKSDTVYGSGINDGMRAERIYTHQLMEDIHRGLADQVVMFEENARVNRKQSKA
jgi:hypothetical protein